MIDELLILNVDDNDAGRYAKSHILKKADLKVIDAATGDEALRLAGVHRPALVLLDVHLPDISGYEVCRILKRDFASTLVLQVSAKFTKSDDRVRGLKGERTHT